MKVIGSVRTAKTRTLLGAMSAIVVRLLKAQVVVGQAAEWEEMVII